MPFAKPRSTPVVAAGATVNLPKYLDVLDRAGRVVCLVIGASLGLAYAVTGLRPDDGSLLWAAGHAPHYYATIWTETSNYVYPPPFAQVTGLLPWPVFILPWMALAFWALWYTTRWLALPIIAIGAVSLALEQQGAASAPLASTLIGNPQIVLAAAMVAGFRHPAAWAFVILTKIGPGIGLVWFAVRREWRSLGIALAATVAVVAASVALGPSAWLDFIAFATGNYATAPPVPVVPIPLVVRVPMALVLVAWGAATGRRWTVPVAAAWAALALYEWSYLVIWAAAVPLWWDDRKARPAEANRVAVLADGVRA